MAQEEYVFGCSYSGSSGGGNGGGRSGGGGGGGGGSNCRSKKIKPKKVPQRGLGVAQLEKIRIEEEQKNVIASSPSDGVVGGGATSFLGVEKFSRPNLAPFHNSPPPPSSSSNLSSPNALFRHSKSAPNIEILQDGCSVSKHSNGEIGSRPMFWGGDYNHHFHHHHHHPFAFDLPYEPPAAAVLPQRSHHFQPPPSSMVNSISPSSVLTSHLEPPSNQSSLPNNYAPQWKDEGKMVGMKRSYPFSLQSPPTPSLHCPSSAPQHDLALCSSGYTPIAEPRKKCIRGSPLLERSRPSEVAGDGEGLNGDFLTLAPPSSNYKHTHPSQQPKSSGSAKESFNFFPVKLFTNQRSNGVRNGNGEEGVDHTVDLNLQL